MHNPYDQNFFSLKFCILFVSFGLLGQRAKINESFQKLHTEGCSADNSEEYTKMLMFWAQGSIASSSPFYVKASSRDEIEIGPHYENVLNPS